MRESGVRISPSPRILPIGKNRTLPECLTPSLECTKGSLALVTQLDRVADF